MVGRIHFTIYTASSETTEITFRKISKLSNKLLSKIDYQDISFPKRCDRTYGIQELTIFDNSVYQTWPNQVLNNRLYFLGLFLEYHKFLHL